MPRDDPLHNCRLIVIVVVVVVIVVVVVVVVVVFIFVIRVLTDARTAFTQGRIRDGNGPGWLGIDDIYRDIDPAVRGWLLLPRGLSADPLPTWRV